VREDRRLETVGSRRRGAVRSSTMSWRTLLAPNVISSVQNVWESSGDSPRRLRTERGCVLYVTQPFVVAVEKVLDAALKWMPRIGEGVASLS
jgi:hypothetical protein